MITQKMLEKKGISCIIIDNGEEAIENAKTNHYDLILMDVHLPGINGTEATTEIRKFNTTTPIVALTAISLNENNIGNDGAKVLLKAIATSTSLQKFCIKWNLSKIHLKPRKVLRPKIQKVQIILSIDS